MFSFVRGVSRFGAVATVAFCLVAADKARCADRVTVVDSVSVYSEALRSDIANAGYDVLSTLPTREEIAQIKDNHARGVLSTIADLAERGTQAMWSSDKEVEQLARDLEFFTGGYVAATAAASVDTDPFDCVDKREACILNHCGSGTSWPCFCCAPCNIAFLACIAGPLIPGT